MSVFFMKNDNKRPVYWENTNGDSHKFWAAHIIEQELPDDSLTGNSTSVPNGDYYTHTSTKKQYVLVRKWGKIGTKGQTMEQIMFDKYEAEKELDRLIYSKEAKGYNSKF